MPRRDGAWRFHGWHLNFLGLNKTGRCAGGGEDVLFCFHDKVFYNPGCSQTQHNQKQPWISHPPASTSWVLELQLCAPRLGERLCWGRSPGSMPHWQTLCPLRPLSSPNEHLQMVKEKLIFLMRQMKMVLLPFALIMFPAPLPSSLCPVIQEAHCCLRMRRTCSSTSGSWPSPWLLQRSAFLWIVSAWSLTSLPPSTSPDRPVEAACYPHFLFLGLAVSRCHSPVPSQACVICSLCFSSPGSSISGGIFIRAGSGIISTSTYWNKIGWIRAGETAQSAKCLQPMHETWVQVHPCKKPGSVLRYYIPSVW